MYALTMDGTTLSLIIGQVITLILALVGFGVSLWREHRNRKWDLEDRRAAREALTRNLDEKFTSTNKKIDENTRVSQEAFHEANDAKNLIASIEQTRNELQLKTIQIADEVRTGTKDVSEAVEAIQDNTGKSAEALTKLSGGPVPVINSERRTKK